MTKSDIVEALRCAADLCSGCDWENAIRDACMDRDIDWTGYVQVCNSVGYVGCEYGCTETPDIKRHRLLEAAQRIEESE